MLNSRKWMLMGCVGLMAIGAMAVVSLGNAASYQAPANQLADANKKVAAAEGIPALIAQQATDEGASLTGIESAKSSAGTVSKMVMDRGADSGRRYDLCVLSMAAAGGGGFSCRREGTRQFTKPQVGVALVPGDQYLVSGLLPDGASAPTITAPSGKVIPVPLDSGMFAIELPYEQVGELQYTEADGSKANIDTQHSAHSLKFGP